MTFLNSLGASYLIYLSNLALFWPLSSFTTVLTSHSSPSSAISFDTSGSSHSPFKLATSFPSPSFAESSHFSFAL